MKKYELVVVLNESASVARAPAMAMLANFSGPLGSMELRPIVPAPARGAASARALQHATPFSIKLERYLVGEVADGDAATIVDELLANENVETAYIKPLVECPIAPLSEAPADAIERSDQVPDFRALQRYLDPSPSGVGVEDAWKLAGGRGDGIRVIDIEGGWRFSHVDLLENTGGLVGGSPYQDKDWCSHGTAVLAEIGGDDNSLGVVGIAPDAMLSAISHGGLGSAKAIYLAAERLVAGDVLLLEMHRPGPRHAYQVRDDQRGYICVEWWPDDFLAIRHAVARGIIVVEAAGNGAEDLDHALYETPGSNFPSDWRNPLRGSRHSGAIVVGAGAPPGGAHGPDRSRLDFSNYGSRVDCQGWGRSVVTAGYGDLFQLAESPSAEEYWYTRSFSGTSSASPMVAGAAASLQGIAHARGSAITPEQLCKALRETGAIQQFNTSERIGSRPDLQALIRKLFDSH